MHWLCWRRTHLSAKYTTSYVRAETEIKQKVLYTGNNIKSMHLSVEASLKKLRTTYIDILYAHWWDWETSIEEMMNGLHMLVQQGKVLYLVRVYNVLDISELSNCSLFRVFPIPLHGSCPRRISTPVIMARRRSSSTKVNGTSSNALSNETSSRCAGLMVCLSSIAFSTGWLSTVQQAWPWLHGVC